MSDLVEQIKETGLATDAPPVLYEPDAKELIAPSIRVVQPTSPSEIKEDNGWNDGTVYATEDNEKLCDRDGSISIVPLWISTKIFGTTVEADKETLFKVVPPEGEPLKVAEAFSTIKEDDGREWKYRKGFIVDCFVQGKGGTVYNLPLKGLSGKAGRFLNTWFAKCKLTKVMSFTRVFRLTPFSHKTKQGTTFYGLGATIQGQLPSSNRASVSKDAYEWYKEQGHIKMK